MTHGTAEENVYTDILKRGEFMNRRISIWLDEEDNRFIKWMAKRDNVTYMEELRIIFYTEFEHCKSIYGKEMKEDLKIKD